MRNNNYVIGVDYGTDSVRAVVVDAQNGAELTTAVALYRRWQEGLYCDAAKNQFRQHPLDYMEGLETVVKDCLSQLGGNTAEHIVGISVATTGSTPVAVDRQGTPLALLEPFEDHPDAMFLLWKDHTAAGEADEINRAAGQFEARYLQFVGGIYSPEWYWAKLLHILRGDGQLENSLYTFVEHSDWMPFLLTGGQDARQIKRNVCAAGHKALWSRAFGGLPPVEFYRAIHPSLEKYHARFGSAVFDAACSAGKLCPDWAARLGLSPAVEVGIGAIDAHMGAVGGGIKPYYLSKVIGTSTCDMMVAPGQDLKGRAIAGISGQVEDSIVPGMVGLEAGQSAFGDIYSWFRDFLLWPLQLGRKDKMQWGTISADTISALKENLLKELDHQAAAIGVEADMPFALDWFNGRRTPDVDPSVTGLIGGLTLGAAPPAVYNALVEATCFGSRAIVECIEEQGVPIIGIQAIGGIATKSDFVIGKLADVLNRPVQVSAAEQAAALGAAMFASVVCGIYPRVEDAIEKLAKGDRKVITPREENVPIYNSRFENYKRYGHMQG